MTPDKFLAFVYLVALSSAEECGLKLWQVFFMGTPVHFVLASSGKCQKASYGSSRCNFRHSLSVQEATESSNVWVNKPYLQDKTGCQDSPGEAPDPWRQL